MENLQTANHRHRARNIWPLYMLEACTEGLAGEMERTVQSDAVLVRAERVKVSAHGHIPQAQRKLELRPQEHHPLPSRRPPPAEAHLDYLRANYTLQLTHSVKLPAFLAASLCLAR